jgi:uncharacterized protein (TIGR02302 family)
LARAPRPDARLDERDPRALRHAALLALAAGLIAQIGDGGARLSEALRPVGAAAATAQARAISIEAWASPPVHTGVAPLYLTDRVADSGPIALPADTEIVLRVFDATEPPVLSAPAAAAAAGAGFVDQGAGAWSATLKLARSGGIAVNDGDLASWSFEAIPDAPPTIAFSEPPSAARSGALQFGFETADDYGVVSARAEIALDAAAAPPLDGVAANTVFEGASFELPLPLTGDAQSAAETVTQDLIAHPFAGLPVVIALIAEDGAGQTARTETRVTMPGRRFTEPLARALIEQRRHLAWSVDAGPRISRVLTAVTAFPEDIFADAGAFLTVRSAQRRLDAALESNGLAAEAAGIAELLWLAALRIEDGDLSDAEKRLRDLQQELSDAIERGAPEDEIAKLMDELRAALNDYLRQLAEQAQRDQADGAQPQPIDPDQTLSQQDLMDMLDRLEEAMRGGMQEMARQMLQQLQQLLENLRMAQPGQQNQGQGQGQGDQTMQQLQEMIDRQQGLADRSFDALRRGRQGQQGQQGQGQQGQQGRQGQGRQGKGDAPGGDQPGGLGDIARDQEGLRRLLEDLRNGLPGQGGGEALGRADDSMGAARDGLEQGDADQALQDQVEALDALREGARDLAQQMQGQQGQARQAGREGQSGDARDEDPFGRPSATNGPLDGDSVKVPDASAMKRARELMDEIRRRAGDRTRPTGELDYLNRLLDRF